MIPKSFIKLIKLFQLLYILWFQSQFWTNIDTDIQTKMLKIVIRTKDFYYDFSNQTCVSRVDLFLGFLEFRTSDE